MNATSRPRPEIPNPLPPDFSILKFVCDWKGLDYAKEKAKIEARMNGRSHLVSTLQANEHDCTQTKREPSKSARQAKLLKTQGLPIPCPFCTLHTREQQIGALMELLFDSILEVAQGVMEGSK